MIQKIETYNKDKRMSLNKIYNSYSKLDKNIWTKEIIFITHDENYSLPIFAFKTKKKGEALFIISGVHGEEPAGPNAIAKNILFLNNLAKKIPIVLIPLCNPKGYRKNWRYPNQEKYLKNKPYFSAGDAELYLPQLKNNKPRKNKIADEAKAICEYLIKNSKTYKPILTLSFHEDDSKTGTYIFSQGKLGSNDPVAKQIVTILKKNNFKFYSRKKTRFNEDITGGIASGVKDGSIDELLASDIIMVNNKFVKGPSAMSVVVIETNSKDIPIKKRITAHSEILKYSLKFYNIIKDLK